MRLQSQTYPSGLKYIIGAEAIFIMALESAVPKIQTKNNSNQQTGENDSATKKKNQRGLTKRQVMQNDLAECHAAHPPLNERL